MRTANSPSTKKTSAGRRFAHFGATQHVEQNPTRTWVVKACAVCNRERQTDSLLMLHSPSSSIETKASWVVALVALFIMAMSFGAAWITAVALKDIAGEVGGTRSIPALASALAWLGAGVGGIMMGRIADRVGTRWTVIFGALDDRPRPRDLDPRAPWPLCIGHGLFIGLIGLGGINAPIYVYVSRWFDRRRGSALALISSGSYLAGAVWPPVFEPADRLFRLAGRHAVLRGRRDRRHRAAGRDLFSPPPEAIHPRAGVRRRLPASARARLAAQCRVRADLRRRGAVLHPDGDAAGPSGRLLHRSRHQPARGAPMLSVLLGTAFLSRQIWGSISDRIGGLATVLVGSAWQAAAMTAFLLTQDEAGLFTVAAAFGLGFTGIIPAYVLAIRELFPASEASWRVPTLLLFSGYGMAAGGWLAGLLYDHFGYYAPAFAAGIGANLLNLLVVGLLVGRRHFRAAYA